LQAEVREIVARKLPAISTERLFPVYEKVAATPKKYPRTWAEMRRNPL
jgi:hypothetical protein